MTKKTLFPYNDQV